VHQGFLGAFYVRNQAQQKLISPYKAIRIGMNSSRGEPRKAECLKDAFQGPAFS
jgi:hypothetical protein